MYNNKKRGINIPLFLYDLLFFDDTINRAYFLACSTVDAKTWIDYVDFTFRDAIDRAFSCTASASDTCISYKSWHSKPPTF